jgi:hypothetical protein
MTMPLGLFLAGASLGSVGIRGITFTFKVFSRHIRKKLIEEIEDSLLVQLAADRVVPIITGLMMLLFIFILTDWIMDKGFVSDVIYLAPFFLAPAFPTASAAFLGLYLSRQQSRATRHNNELVTDEDQP